MTTSALARGGDDLPDWHELTAAFRAAFGSGGAATEHPVTACACQLARVHRQPCPRRRTVVARRRARLIAAIDAWAAEHVRGPARVGSIGAYVDRMAAAAAAAHQALHSGEPVSGMVHMAFTDAAALAAGWTEIALEVAPRAYGIGVDQ
ncbi:hypothetical protein [Nocardia miyunensis]|uniref:hypothetical protein n=1 Tax=Nocardia miyunensis TaxID=282684 RepID=UPI00082BBF75|nr:hypothetical protein [Nocardia miyunensis]